MAASSDDLVEAFDVPPPTFDLKPRYNISPGQEALVVAEDRHGRRMGLLTWGLVPHWADEFGWGMINARAESVAEKPSFREAFERRRCLVPADGFYEWKREGEAKVPYWIHRPDGGLMSFAAIWERWAGAGGDPRHTFAILTTDSNADLAPIHPRMPVVVAAPDRDRWLDRRCGQEDLRDVLGPPPAGRLVSHAVDRRVNRPSEDDAGLIKPV